MYWAEALAAQDKDADLKAEFSAFAKAFADSEAKIVGELNEAQGPAVKIGGYYHANDTLTADAMRPSATLNALIAG